MPCEPFVPKQPSSEPGFCTPDTTIEDFRQALQQHFPSKEELLAEARAQTKVQTQRRLQAQKTVGTMLGIALLAGIWWIDPVLQSQSLNTALGQQIHHRMADGSQIVLNTDSLLILEHRLRTRSMTLLRGEAAFTVAKEWRPFIVKSGSALVRDIGTAFTVRRLEASSLITVLEGVVEVSHHTGMKSNPAPLVLRAGQSLQTHDWHSQPQKTAATTASAIETVDVTLATAWRQGRIVFDGTPLHQAVAEIQRYHAAPISVDSVVPANLRLSGVYDISRIDALLDILPQALPVQVERRADGSVQIRNRNNM